MARSQGTQGTAIGLGGTVCEACLPEDTEPVVLPDPVTQGDTRSRP